MGHPLSRSSVSGRARCGRPLMFISSFIKSNAHSCCGLLTRSSLGPLKLYRPVRPTPEDGMSTRPDKRQARQAR